MTRTVYVVPHCHWDREWYQPHELFRWRLVQMIDELLDHMEQHPEFRSFTLDGQSIVIDDYLALRPEHEHRLRALIESGRVVIGPWWVQPDEFLPSGESHIRNFQRGIRRAEALGGCMRVGHCADQFGHIAQMPQIMSQLGLTSACLWRGVADDVPGWSFYWEAPDGTRLPVLYLRNSYSSGWRIPEETEDLVERVRRQERDLRDGEPALLMNGTDHSRMQKDVPELLGRAQGNGYDFKLVTLADFEFERMRAGIDEYVHPGELRSPDRSNVLVGVLSAREEIKQRDFEVSGALERYAEPLELLASLHNGPDGLAALRHAWDLLLENAPHDSICGCSVDQTHREMFPRYDRSEQLARQVARESMAHVVGQMAVSAAGALAVFRPVPHAPATFELQAPGSWTAEYAALPSGEMVRLALGPVRNGETYRDEEVPPWGVVRHLDFLREGRYDARYIESMEWRLADGQIEVETLVGAQALNTIDDERVRREVRDAVASGLVSSGRIIVRESATRSVRGILPAGSSIGVELMKPASDESNGTDDLACTVDSIANAYYEVRLKRGRLDITDWQHGIAFKNVNLFVDEGDRGDEYNADILPDAELVHRRVQLRAIRRDTVSATLEYAAELQVPERLKRDRSARTARRQSNISIVVRVTLWAGVPRVDFEADVTNTARDHRLRALFPLPFTVARAITENQFHVAERPLVAAPWNGTSAELPPTTFPQKTFAAFEANGGGMAVFNRGLQEGEVVTNRAGKQAYALTLLRCVGWLSRPDLSSRRGGAGPTIATEDSQSQGKHTFHYAVASYNGGWREAGIQPLAHAWAFPPLVFATNAHEGAGGDGAPLAMIEPPSVVPSALHRSANDGAPIVRVYNASGEHVTARIAVPAAHSEPARADLLERPTRNLDREGEGWSVALRQWEIATVRFGR